MKYETKLEMRHRCENMLAADDRSPYVEMTQRLRHPRIRMLDLTNRFALQSALAMCEVDRHKMVSNPTLS